MFADGTFAVERLCQVDPCLWFRRDGSRRLKSFLVLDVDEQMVGTRRDETLEDNGGVSLPSGQT